MADETFKLIARGTNATLACAYDMLTEELRLKLGKFVEEAIQHGRRIAGPKGKVSMAMSEATTCHLLDGTAIQGHLVMFFMFPVNDNEPVAYQTDFFIPIDPETGQGTAVEPFKEIDLQ